MEAWRGEGNESSEGLEEEHPSGRKSKCKGPEAGLCSACLRTSREVSVVKVEDGGGGGPGHAGPGGRGEDSVNFLDAGCGVRAVRRAE